MKTEYQLPNGRTLEIVQDENPTTPREWDNLCDFIFIGKYSNVGDKHDFHETHNNFSAHMKYVARKMDAAYIAPIYGYSKRGLVLSETPFSCPWDSGKLGFAVITKEKLREGFDRKRINGALIEKGLKNLKGELDTLNQWLCGDIWGFKVYGEDEDDVEDSCLGFYGSDLETNGILEHLCQEDVDYLKNTKQIEA